MTNATPAPNPHDYRQRPPGWETDPATNSLLRARISDAQQWEPPIPLTPEQTPTLPYPTHTFPPWIRDAVQDAAASILVPQDMAACVAIGALAVATTGRLNVQIEYGYTEPCNLFIAVGAQPTAGKSPVINTLLQDPIGQLEQTLHKEHETRQIQLRQAIKLAKADNDEYETQRLETEHAKPAPLLVIGDVTPEMLASILNDQQRGISIVSDEGGPLLDFDRYKASDAATKLEPYLQGWSQAAMKTARITRGVQHVPKQNANVSLVVTVQPSVLDAMYRMPDLENRGFIARMSIALPDSIVGKRDYLNYPEATPHIRNTYNTRLISIARRAALSSTATTLQFTPEAAHYFREIRQMYENARGSGQFVDSKGRINPMKAESMAARFAGLLAHANNPDTDTVELDDLKAGEEVAGYFVAQEGAIRQRLAAAVDPPEVKAVQRLQQMVRDGEIRAGEWERQSDLARGPRMFRDKTMREATLRVLEDRLWLRTGVDDNGPGRPVATVMLRPDIVDWNT